MRRGKRLGIDIGGTWVKLALVNENGKVLDVQRINSSTEPHAMVRAIHQAIQPWTSQKLLGTGVGVPGDVDPEQGLVRFAPNLRWRQVPLKKYFEKVGFPKPLHFENDATAAGWGAYHVELKRKALHVIVLTLGTGVGGGLVIDGKIHRGATGSAGELGHVTVDPKGPACVCGSRGCLESYLGGAALVQRVRKSLSKSGRVDSDLSPKDLFRMAKSGNRIAQQAWQEAGWALGVALGNFLNIFNPNVILLTGGVAAAAPLFLPAAKREMTRRSFETPRRAVDIRVARANENLGVIGAGLLVQ